MSNFRIHSGSEKFNVGPSVGHNNQLIRSHKSLMKIKKKSYAMLSVDRHSQALQEYKISSQHQTTETTPINFLKAIILKKKQQQQLHQKLTDEEITKNIRKLSLQQNLRSLSKDYDYYDMVVRDIITSVRSKQNIAITQHPNIPKKFKKPIKRKQQFALKFDVNTSVKNMMVNPAKISLKYSSMSKTESVIKYSTPKRDTMIFRVSEYSDSLYERKITSYLLFLYQVAYSNRIYVNLSLNCSSKHYKVKIGKGNNSLLVKGLFKRRFWFENVVGVSEEVNIVWTQENREKVHQIQTNTTSGRIIFPRKKYKRDEIDQNIKIMSAVDFYEAEKLFRKYQGLGSNFPQYNTEIITNHLPDNYIIGSKKALFMVMDWYYKNMVGVDPLTSIPKTYHLHNTTDEKWRQFLNESTNKQEIWIIKPGENTNRGNGINLAKTSFVSRFLKKQTHKNGDAKTYIVQQYINPFLYQNRKFDIRHYLMVTSINGYIKAYWYQEGYIRTSSSIFDLDDISNNFMHLTNDAIQKHSAEYGKYEAGNKISYSQFQRYLDTNYPHKKYNFQEQIINKMKAITTDVIKASFMFLDPNRKSNNFQIFGMDFIIDSKFKPYLIEINANPCLETSCQLLGRIVPTMLQNSLRLAVDPLLPPTDHYPLNRRYQLSDRILQKMKYQLIFDEIVEGEDFRSAYEQCPVKFGIKQKIYVDQDIYEEPEGNQNVVDIDLQWEEEKSNIQ